MKQYETILTHDGVMEIKALTIHSVDNEMYLHGDLTITDKEGTKTVEEETVIIETNDCIHGCAVLISLLVTHRHEPFNFKRKLQSRGIEIKKFRRTNSSMIPKIQSNLTIFKSTILKEQEFNRPLISSNKGVALLEKLIYTTEGIYAKTTLGNQIYTKEPVDDLTFEGIIANFQKLEQEEVILYIPVAGASD